MSLTRAALARLKAQRDADYYSPWQPGKQLTDAELIWAHIQKLETQLEEYKEKDFLSSWATNPDRMGGQFSQDEIDRSRNGGW